MKKIGVVGGSGYAGQQLVWILARHPEVKIEFISTYSNGGKEFDELYGSYKNILDIKCISNDEVIDNLDKVDLIFTAMPHGKAYDIAKAAFDKGVKVIDLGSDFRLVDPKLRDEYYGIAGEDKLFDEVVYGLTEINREAIKGAKIISNPGCYPTATLLGLTPLVKHNLINLDSIIIDAKSGVSGAGRGLNQGSLMCEAHENVKAYKVASHRHTPEIEQLLTKVAKEEVMVTFTPTLVPTHRGILSTIYGKLNKEITDEELIKIYQDEYKGEKFIRVKDEPSETKWVKVSNYCDISMKIDKRRNTVIIMSAIDNLIKGAAGQGVQNMNLIFGFKEDLALEFLPVFP